MRKILGICAIIALSTQTASADQVRIDWSTFDLHPRCDGVVMFDQTSHSETYSGYTLFRLPDGRNFFERYEDGVPVGYGSFDGLIYELQWAPEVPLDKEDEMYVYRSFFFEYAAQPDWNGSSELLPTCVDENSIVS